MIYKEMFEISQQSNNNLLLNSNPQKEIPSFEEFEKDRRRYWISKAKATRIKNRIKRDEEEIEYWNEIELKKMDKEVNYCMDGLRYTGA